MKRMKNILVLTCGMGLMTSCMDLNLSPLSMATNENWYANETQVEMSINDLFRANVWNTINERWTDDEYKRMEVTPFTSGGINGQTGDITGMWDNCYRVIGRDNAVIDKLMTMPEGFMSQAKYDQYLGEALFARACMYSRLVTLFGDVPYSDHTIDIETAFTMGRTPKAEVLKKIYADFDVAIDNLPVSTGAVQRPTKGAALGMKARIALYNEDWSTAAECAKACMDLNAYELYPDFGKLFLQSTHNTSEAVFSIPRSITFNVTLGSRRDWLPRNRTGYAATGPTWDLLAAFLCSDGLPIDESPLFDSHNPFENRDPRCAETIVAFGSNFMGVEYDPSPLTGDMVMDYDKGEEIKNNDNKNNTEHACYNALLLKKGIDKSCLDNAYKTEHDLSILRYADVLLMYAEAMIEKGTIDQTVLDAMNEVRARAYGKKKEDAGYPKITTTEQAELRTILRTERRMEFAFENLRYFDLQRWRLFGKVHSMKNYGIYQTKDANMEHFVTPGHWFWGTIPQVDENGIADLSVLEQYGAQSLSQRAWDDRQYLWPIPTQEVLINDNIKQNPGY